MPNVLCRLPNHVGDCCMTLPALRLLEASGFTPMLTGKRWAEDLMSGMGWRFDPIEGHVTEDLHRIRYISNHLGPRPLGLLFPNSFSSALLFSIGRVRNAGFPTDGRRFLLDKVVEEPGTMHEVERFFRLAHGAIKAWGGTPAWDSVPEELGMKLLARHEAAARNLMAEHGIPENFALLAPIARGLHHGKEKQWKHFNELCGPLRDMGIEPIVFPSVREEEANHAACPNARILPPTTLGNYAALAKRARIVIATGSCRTEGQASLIQQPVTPSRPVTPANTEPFPADGVFAMPSAFFLPSASNSVSLSDRTSA